jgi:hypothetical protein
MIEQAKAVAQRLRENVLPPFTIDKEAADTIDALVAEVERLKQEQAEPDDSDINQVHEGSAQAHLRDTTKLMQEQSNEIVSIEGMPVGMGNEPEQAEPVAWVYDAATYPEGDLRGRQWQHNVFSVSKPYMDNNMVRNLRGLYTAPQGQTALLRQALEALENMKNPDFDAVDSFEQCEAAIAAINQHLGEA